MGSTRQRQVKYDNPINLCEGKADIPLGMSKDGYTTIMSSFLNLIPVNSLIN